MIDGTNVRKLPRTTRMEELQGNQLLVAIVYRDADR